MTVSHVPNTPFAKTLTSHTCHIETNTTQEIYPPLQSYVGVRLTTQDPCDVLGVLCILDDKPMQSDRLELALHLLQGTAVRTARELERVREDERLITAKNAAKMDAENKIKFLADMSHEIR